MTTNINDAIKAIKSFLLANPDEATVKALIKRLQDHEQVHQGQRVMADLPFKNELPESFPLGDKNLIRKFQRLSDQLTEQGIALEYKSNDCGKYCLKWKLTRAKETGRLLLFTANNSWELHGFKLEDEQGNLLTEFSDVSCYDLFSRRIN